MDIGRIVAVFTAEPVQSPVPAERDQRQVREPDVPPQAEEAGERASEQSSA